MVKACSAFNCNNREKKGSGLSFNSFPHHNSVLLNQWIVDTKRKNFIPSTCNKLSGKQFSEDSFQLQTNASYSLLKSDVGPSRLDVPKHLNVHLPKKRRSIVKHQLPDQEYANATLEESQPEKNAIEIFPPVPSTSSSVVQVFECQEPEVESVENPITMQILPSSTNMHLCRQLKILRQQLKRRDKKIYSMKNLICSLETKLNTPQT